MRKFLSVVCTGLMAACISGCDVDVTEEGQLPDVDVQGGRLPEVDVQTPDVDVRMEEKNVQVPDVDVEMKDKKMTVPDVDVSVPDEGDNDE